MARLFVTASSQYFANTSACPIVSYPFSIACFYRPTLDAQDVAIVCFASGANRHLLYQQHSQIGIFTATAGASGEAKATLGTPFVAASAWYLVGGVVESAASRTAYVGDLSGNVFTASDSTSVNPGAMAQTYVGAYYNAGLVAGFYGNGGITDVAIWNAALTRADFVKMNNRYAPSTIRRRNLVANYKLNESGPYERDSVGFRGLTASGTPSVISSPGVVYPRNPRRRINTEAASAGNFAVYDSLIFGGAM